MYERLKTNKTQYKLTVLILTLPNRDFKPLYKQLQKQIITESVQVIYLGDNKSMSVGEKRNKALSIADGKYITFIDDDDEIAPDYIKEIMQAIELNPEVITFNFEKFSNGENRTLHKYYPNNGRAVYRAPDKSHYKMLPNHLSVWRKDVINKDFPDRSISEDHQWAERMAGSYTNVHNIDKVLYTYLYNKSTSETH